MRILARFRMAILALFRRHAETARLNDELQFHLDEQIAENIARGLSPEEARTTAMRSFGNRCSCGTRHDPPGAGTGLKNFCETFDTEHAPSRARPDSV